MKVLMAILLVILMMGVTPAFASTVSAADRIVDPMAVKGKGIDTKAVLELTGQNESEKISETNMESSNKTTENLSIVKEADTTANVEKSSTKPIAETDIDEIVMQSTSYNCGPAALATVLNNIGINATEQELVSLAGTDENGTTMHGLVQAAQAKGLKATGVKLSVDELKKGDIIFLNISGSTHYSVIKEVTPKSVLLADPKFGNIEMPIEMFNKVYSGNALVINDPDATTKNLSSSTDETSTNLDVQLENNQALTEKLQSIKGKGKITIVVRFLKKGWVFVSNISVVAWLLSIMPESWKKWFYGKINKAYANYKHNQEMLKKKYGMEYEQMDFCITI